MTGNRARRVYQMLDPSKVIKKLMAVKLPSALRVGGVTGKFILHIDQKW